jgi:D-tyrosyl-tRNA(Tyr) deacylase
VAPNDLAAEPVHARVPRTVHPAARWDDAADMRAVCQRVSRARVTVAGSPTGAIAQGLVVLLGIARGDAEADADRLAGKVARLRVFEDDDGKFARSLIDVGGAALVVSQFTLIADSRKQKGTRPDFSGAAPAAEAEPLYERFCSSLKGTEVPVQTGVFGARMSLELTNDGPVTIILEVGPAPILRND